MRGFTLIEIIVVIGIFALILGLGLFISMDSYRGYLFRSERDTVVSLLEKARSRSINNIDQTAWGVCMIGSDYVIFRGSCTVGAATNEPVPGNPAATIVGLASPGIVFSQLGGTTTAAVVKVVENNSTSTISINSEGRIDW